MKLERLAVILGAGCGCVDEGDFLLDLMTPTMMITRTRRSRHPQPDFFLAMLMPFKKNILVTEAKFYFLFPLF